MDQIRELSLHRRAQMALDAFSPSERTKIERALGLLRDPTASDFVKANVRKLAMPEPTYLMRATPHVRILFNKTPDGIQVLDIVRRDKLRSFQELATPTPTRATLGRRPLVQAEARRRAKRKRRIDEGR